MPKRLLSKSASLSSKGNNNDREFIEHFVKVQSDLQLKNNIQCAIPTYKSVVYEQKKPLINIIVQSVIKHTHMHDHMQTLIRSCAYALTVPVKIYDVHACMHTRTHMHGQEGH